MLNGRACRRCRTSKLKVAIAISIKVIRFLMLTIGSATGSHRVVRDAHKQGRYASILDPTRLCESEIRHKRRNSMQ